MKVWATVTNPPKAMRSSTLWLLAAAALFTGVIATTAYSADSEFVSGRVAKEIRHETFSGKRLRATRTVTLEKAGKKITGQVMMEVVTGGKIS